MFDTLNSEADIRELITNETQEDLHLEFKRSDSIDRSDDKKNEISKDVSAFANSDGGLLIYGIIEAIHKASDIDSGVDVDVYDKEWLEQIINSRISPRIDGVKIKPIPLTESPQNRTLYIVDVPKSFKAHQAADKKFYKRFNFQNVPMEHYEIMDVLNRITAPDLSLEIISDFIAAERGFKNPSIKFSFELANASDKIAEYTVVRFYIDRRLGIIDRGFFEDNIVNDEYTLKDHSVDVTSLTKMISIPTLPPVWKGLKYNLSPKLHLRFPEVRRGDSFLLAYELSSPGMKVKKGGFVLHAGQNSARLTDESDNEEFLISELAL